MYDGLYVFNVVDIPDDDEPEVWLHIALSKKHK